MPNLRPPVINVEQAMAYRSRILAALTPECAAFVPLMTLYLTDCTSPEEIVLAHDSQCVVAVKLYPVGVTTNSEDGVTDMRKVVPICVATFNCC
jgi:dihydroorotase